MSLALLGDALLYAVLPAYAADFGLTLPWVGVMLSVNRFVRVFAYGLIAQATARFGVRAMCIAAACSATLSTLIYGFGTGPLILLFARLLWGLTYGVLVLATLSYAVSHRKRAGTRIGVGQAVQRIGPILALFGGAWLVGHVGANSAFVVLACFTALALPIALRLPKVPAQINQARKPTGRLTRPAPIDVLFFLQGYGVDGVFAMTVTLILAQNNTMATAVLGGGALLAMRHFAEAVAAPLFGWIADRYGAHRVFVSAAFLTMLGFMCVAVGWAVLGALIMLTFRGALASLGPAVIAQGLSEQDDVLGPLARMQAWRDFGAACGPLMTGVMLAVTTPELLHGVVAIALALGIAYWIRVSPPPNVAK
ncbi:MAG: MFS transporter [Planktotalea sp.]|uniref:MFS transporter n=1 Tax=Planktotalea sp. TaxID=2029877 RepID=UPI003C713730